jgi:hypothetical protein
MHKTSKISRTIKVYKRLKYPRMLNISGSLHNKHSSNPNSNKLKFSPNPKNNPKCKNLSNPNHENSYLNPRFNSSSNLKSNILLRGQLPRPRKQLLFLNPQLSRPVLAQNLNQCKFRDSTNWLLFSQWQLTWDLRPVPSKSYRCR